MKVIKRNQIIIFVIAMMLVTAGYLNFIETNDTQILETSRDDETIGDATLVSTEAIVENDEILESESTEAEDSKVTEEESSIMETGNKIEENIDEYYVKSRLERDNLYSQLIESYQKMMSSETISAEQRAIAQNEITKINNIKNSLMISENLIKTKGFKDVIILVNEESVNVIVKSESLKQEEVAQIQNIVSREMHAEIENIHISYKQ